MAHGVTTASISGLITDEKGEGLPGATVVAVHTPSGTQYATSTLANGRFNFPSVRIGGPYVITTTYVGYQEQKREGINLSLGQNFTADFKLASGNVQLEEVVVSGTKDPVLNADRTGAATNVSNEQITRLPTLNRSLEDYTRLTPQSNGSNFGGRNDLYNNISIDGSLFNNAFGLSSRPGGQTNSQPISLDAIEEIQINLAPYDVRQGGFTGAGINAVTRSGTNNFQGSVYTFLKNQRFIGERVGDITQANPNFSYNQTGLRLGGPIIKNKLFFFVSGEIERREDPIGSFVANRPEGPNATPPPGRGSNTANVNASDLNDLRNFLITNYNYNPGSYELYGMETYSDKILTRIDWNINNNHKLSFRYNYLKSFRDVPTSNSFSTGGRQNSANSLPFSNSNYLINNNLNSFITELNSSFGNKFSNNLILGYTGFRDFRESRGAIFPLVDIENGNGQTITTFGYEPFTPNNQLDQDVFQLSDNFTIYAGKHVLTVGTSNEYYKFANGFTPNFYGRFRFSTFSDFYASANSQLDEDPNTNLSNASQYELTYSAVPGVAVPLAELEVAQLGFYAQDEWSVRNNLKITGGVRIDVPFYPIQLQRNDSIEQLTFAGGERIDVSRYPDAKLLWSPRVGFNWDVKGDRTTQVRGGTGIFTGRIPFVWLSNQASNNGVLFGSEFRNNPNNRPFSPDPRQYIPQNPSLPGTVLINATADDFRFPQVFRTNLAVDQQLPWGLVGTLEAIYTKDINAVFHRNANLEAPAGVVEGDGRPQFPGTDAGRRINDFVTNAIILDNTNQGYQLNLTAQLQKTFGNGLFASLAYNYQDARDLSSSTSAIANTAFSNNQIVGSPNDAVLSYSSYLLRHRIVGAASYRKEYAKFLGTTVSLVYVARSGNPLSYVYGNDLNSDGAFGNDLIYVPRSRDEIVLVPAGNTDTRTPDQIWQQLNSFIEQDEYLSSRRGQYAERNGAFTPWSARLDFRILQDFFVNVAGKRNTIQLSLDVQNLGNLLNRNWGIVQQVSRNQVLSFAGYEGVDNTGRPTFSFPFNSGTNPLTETFRNDTDLISRWQAQFGIRYIFN